MEDLPQDSLTRDGYPQHFVQGHPGCFLFSATLLLASTVTPPVSHIPVLLLGFGELYNDASICFYPRLLLVLLRLVIYPHLLMSDLNSYPISNFPFPGGP